MTTVINFGVLQKGDTLSGFSEGTFLITTSDTKYRLVFTDLDSEGLPRVVGSVNIPEFETKASVEYVSMLSKCMAMFQFEDGTANLIEFSDLDSNFEVKTTTNIIIGDNEISIDDGDIKISTF